MNISSIRLESDDTVFIKKNGNTKQGIVCQLDPIQSKMLIDGEGEMIWTNAVDVKDVPEKPDHEPNSSKKLKVSTKKQKPKSKEQNPVSRISSTETDVAHSAEGEPEQQSPALNKFFILADSNGRYLDCHLRETLPPNIEVFCQFLLGGRTTDCMIHLERLHKNFIAGLDEIVIHFGTNDIINQKAKRLSDSLQMGYNF